MDTLYQNKLMGYNDNIDNIYNDNIIENILMGPF